jgi:hypothetical protein
MRLVCESEIHGEDPKYRASESSACYKGEHSGTETKQALEGYRCEGDY